MGFLNPLPRCPQIHATSLTKLPYYAAFGGPPSPQPMEFGVCLICSPNLHRFIATFSEQMLNVSLQESRRGKHLLVLASSVHYRLADNTVAVFRVGGEGI